ncbi:MAG: LuxR C-terminal-related transcriptional regulator [Clostridia bacterium]
MSFYPHLNDIYITERLKQRLTVIGSASITTVIAPMGFGKTTAITWWMKQQSKYHPDWIILRQMIDTPGITDFWTGLCRALRGYPTLAEQLAALGFPDDIQAMSIMAELIEDALSETDRRIYYVLDDLHIFTDKRLASLLLYLSRRLENRIQFLLLSRNPIFGEEERMRMGASLGEITADDLRLHENEVAQYAKRCGLAADQRDIAALAAASEGWISMVYLNFKAYAQTGVWISGSADIFNLIDQILLTPLSERQQEFLILIGITDGFTAEEAAWLWQQPDTEELLESLSQSNAFITRNENGVYRYHHMLRQCVRQKFSLLSAGRQAAAYTRLGDWYLSRQEYVAAELSYHRAGAWGKLLDTLSTDCGKSLGGEYQETLYQWSVECPVSLLMGHPDAVLILMRKLFTFQRIPEMFRLKEVLLKSLDTIATLTEQERQDYLGECELVMSFLKYNDISAMSAHHRNACAMMSRSSRCIDPNGTWTFGAPSVFMMYHRTVGGLDHENAEMRECMPYYYQVVDSHGNGAEHVMQGETDFMRNLLTDAQISYHLAVGASTRRKQHSIRVTAEFLGMRMALLEGDAEKLRTIMTGLRDSLREDKQYILLNTLDMCQTWIYSLLGHTEEVPAWIASGAPSSMVMYPATPMLEAIYIQYLLAQGRYTEVVAKKEESAALYERIHSLQCSIHLHIQLAAALDMLDRRGQAVAELKTALDLALPDGIVMPFAENCDYITTQLQELQKRGIYPNQIEKILTLAEGYRESKQRILRALWGEDEDYGLSGRELEIAKLAAQRLTNREIADKLHLAEGTVKNRLSRIFEKLEVSPGSKNKRLELEKRFRTKK